MARSAGVASSISLVMAAHRGQSLITSITAVPTANLRPSQPNSGCPGSSPVSTTNDGRKRRTSITESGTASLIARNADVLITFGPMMADAVVAGGGQVVPLEEATKFPWRKAQEHEVMTYLASLAAERHFYNGDNSVGVGGDLGRSPTCRVRSVVGHDVPVGVGFTVGTDVERGLERLLAPDEPEVAQRVDGEVRHRLHGRHGLAQHEQPGQHCLGIGAIGQRPPRGNGFAPAQCGVGGRPQRREETVGSETGVEEGVPDLVSDGLIELHDPIMTDGP